MSKSKSKVNNNPVAKHMNTFNRASTMVNRKKEENVKKCRGNNE